MLDALQTLTDNGLTVETQNAVLNDIFENDGFEDDDDRRLSVALLWYRQQGNKCDPSDCTHEHGETVKIGGAEYLVLTDDEADAAFDEYLEQLLDEKGMVPGADGPYFDRAAWKKDEEMGGRGCLSRQDGNENEFCAEDGEWYYLYRTN